MPSRLRRVTAWFVLVLMLCFSMGEGMHALSAGHATHGDSDARHSDDGKCQTVHSTHRCCLSHFSGKSCRFSHRHLARSRPSRELETVVHQGPPREATGPQWRNGLGEASATDECPFCQCLAHWLSAKTSASVVTSQPLFAHSIFTQPRPLALGELRSPHLTRGPPAA